MDGGPVAVEYKVSDSPIVLKYKFGDDPINVCYKFRAAHFFFPVVEQYKVDEGLDVAQ